MNGPDRLWVADITYVPTRRGFLHLAVVLDAWSRRVVGWSMATHLRTELVLDALDMALEQRRPESVIHPLRPGVSIHLDRLRAALRGGRRPAIHGIGRRRLRRAVECRLASLPAPDPEMFSHEQVSNALFGHRLER